MNEDYRKPTNGMSRRGFLAGLGAAAAIPSIAQADSGVHFENPGELINAEQYEVMVSAVDDLRAILQLIKESVVNKWDDASAQDRETYLTIVTFLDSDEQELATYRDLDVSGMNEKIPTRSIGLTIEKALEFIRSEVTLDARARLISTEEIPDLANLAERLAAHPYLREHNLADWLSVIEKY